MRTIWPSKICDKEPRLLKRSKLDLNTGCLEWGGAINGDGYGYILHGRKQWRCNRLVWTLAHGEIPKGIIVCHKCDNRKCINPEHLFLGSLTDNNRDRAAKGRSRDQRGQKNNMAKLTDADIREIRNLYKTGLFQRVIGNRFGVSQTLIGQIVRNKRWKHVA